MSHFSVAVIIRPKDECDIKDVLEKYEESLEVFFDVIEDSELEDYRKQYIEKLEEMKAAGEPDPVLTGNYMYDCFDSFMRSYVGYSRYAGKYGTWTNPDAKWDWWVIGGRFENRLITKDGQKTNSAKVKDIDWEAMNERNKKEAAEFFDNETDSFLRAISGIKKEETREEYVNRQETFNTYAVVDVDKWASKGEMFWFGLSSESDDEAIKWSNEYYDNFIKDLEEDATITIVDCHI